MKEQTKIRSMRPPTISKLTAEARYPSIENIAAAAFSEMVPPVRMTVPEAAEKYMRLGSGSGNSRPWRASKTPYMVEPLLVLNDLDHQGMIFVGPARTGKSVGALAWVSHTVVTDPEDMMVVQMDRDNARKWSKGELDRFLQASPEVRSRQMVRREDDNTFDKIFKSGMKLLVVYPTATNLSNITVGRVWLFDYERMDDLVEGEGTPFDMAQKRTQTKGRFAMTVAEASPNPHKEITDPKWRASPEAPHEAPPIRGIFELYNRGDRRRYHWKCPCCDEWFEPHFRQLHWGETDDPIAAKEATVLVCPNNGCVLKPSMKAAMNAAGKWVPEGGMLTPDGEIVARPGMTIRRSDIASFWLFGPAAAYQPWGELVAKYLRALHAFETTLDDGPLRTTVTTDQGDYFIPASRLSERTVEELLDRAEDWGSTEEEPTVPEDTRFLLATVDVQKTSFVVQVMGGNSSGDLTVVDGFKFRLSNRLNAKGERLPIDPFAFGEDWQVLDELLTKSYPLSDGSGRRMRIRAVACDSGGGEGSTRHAYSNWRRLRAEGSGDHRRFILVKGEPSKTAPASRTTFPDSSKKDKHATARGDVPVLLLNSNRLKDQVAQMLSRRVSDDGTADRSGAGGIGMIRYPNWMPTWFYNQMTNEIRTEKGWENPAKRRNEVFDLSYYAVAVVTRTIEKESPFIHFGFDTINFDDPPTWASPWDANSDVFFEADDSDPEKAVKPVLSFAELGRNLA